MNSWAGSWESGLTFPQSWVTWVHVWSQLYVSAGAVPSPWVANHCICFLTFRILTFRTLQGSVKMSEFPPALPCANRYPFIKFLPSLAVCIGASSVRMGYVTQPGLKSSLEVRAKDHFMVQVQAHASHFTREAAESRGMISGFRTRETQVWPWASLFTSPSFSSLSAKHSAEHFTHRIVATCVDEITYIYWNC